MLEYFAFRARHYITSTLLLKEEKLITRKDISISIALYYIIVQSLQHVVTHKNSYLSSVSGINQLQELNTLQCHMAYSNLASAMSPRKQQKGDSQ